MSLYHLQKLLYQLNKEDRIKDAFNADLPALLKDFDLSAEESRAIINRDIGLLYVLGVNGQILMHYAAFLNIEWFDYLELMRAGIKRYGPVRAGVYAMTGGGQSFTAEGRH